MPHGVRRPTTLTKTTLSAPVGEATLTEARPGLFVDRQGQRFFRSDVNTFTPFGSGTKASGGSPGQFKLTESRPGLFSDEQGNLFVKSDVNTFVPFGSQKFTGKRGSPGQFDLTEARPGLFTDPIGNLFKIEDGKFVSATGEKKKKTLQKTLTQTGAPPSPGKKAPQPRKTILTGGLGDPGLTQPKLGVL